MTDYRLYLLPSTSIAMDRLSHGLDRIGQNITAIWADLDAAGFTTPRFMRGRVAEFAMNERARDDLERFWRESCRESLARAPLKFSGGVRGESAELPYRSELLWNLREDARRAAEKGNPYTHLEPTLRRYSERQNAWPEPIHDLIVHRQEEIPEHLKDSSPWCQDSDNSSRKHELIEAALTQAMQKRGIHPDSRRTHATFPIFPLGSMIDGFELVLYLDRVRKLTSGWIEVKLGAFPEGKNIYTVMSRRENSAAYLELRDFVPFFDSYLFFTETISDLRWNVSAIAALSAVIRDRLPYAFPRLAYIESVLGPPSSRERFP